MNLSLQDNEAVPKIFGGISVILSGDLLQLPPVQQQQVFMKHKKRISNLSGFVMGICFPFIQIGSDPEFADI